MVEPRTPMSALASQICTHISSVFSKPSSSPSPLDVMAEEISDTSARNGRIFVYQVGREGLMVKVFCMRLAHLGLSAHCVFDMTTPPISSPILLIASLAPDGFSTVDAICGVGQSNDARVLLLTAQPEFVSSVKYMIVIAHITAQTMDDDHSSDGDGDGGGIGSRSLLPMGSVYEGAMFVLFEMVVFRLAEVLGESPEAVRSRHTNLE